METKRTVGDLLSQGISCCFLFLFFVAPMILVLPALEAHLHLRLFLYVGINFSLLSNDTDLFGKLC
jgi:phosphate starvation-inducible membrane PsiE